MYSTYALTDESYAIASVRTNPDTSGVWVLTVQILCQILWLGSGIAGAITLVLHWWRRDPGVSIVGGTLGYMVLVNWVL